MADEADKPSLDDCSFAVEGLKLFGAACRGSQLSISAEISTNLHLTRLRWIKKSDSKCLHMNHKFIVISDKTLTSVTDAAKIVLPVYLNSTRQNLLFTVELPIKEGQKIHEFHERGVAIIASTALN